MKRLLTLGTTAFLTALMGVAQATGDVNGDGVVDEKDVEAVENHILQKEQSGTFDLSQADVNSDGVVNVADVDRIQQHVTDGTTLPVTNDVILPDTGYSMEISNVNVKPGSDATLVISLTNPIEPPVVSFQMDLILPEGVTLAGDPEFTSRAPSTHELLYNKIGENEYIIMCVSPDLRAFDGTEGPLFTIPISVASTVADGEYEVWMDDIVLDTTHNGHVVMPDDESEIMVAEVTGLEAVKVVDTDDEVVSNAVLYTIDGRVADATSHGLLVGEGLKIMRR